MLKCFISFTSVKTRRKIMLNISEFVDVGYVSKSHGIEGNVVLRINDSFPDETDEIEFIFIEIDGGLVPFKIVEINLRNSLTALLKVEDIDTDEQLKRLIGCPVFFAKKDLNSNISESNTDITGYLLFDKKQGEIGLIDSVLDYKTNELIRILLNKKEILIPFNNELVVSIDNKKKEIIMRLPDGLLDINKQS